ncbi:cyclic nucleotide-binding domain-containing protein [Curvibacter sp. RS43]|jgi:CRP/FNR family cyclic AMP-dependent transcriptional regulator|uniref:Cyclic nucleotide-binding domain-containing protein n=1 Tax=Curvibacter microcysteis TaxID=3026419 RepID=A0ABT5MKD0_9BURK|nr:MULTISPECIES: cyclic nucleotide-binding domain-containing protein [unclassified Curvibacter]MDD0811598.1 cyclic nucleotide-binding domain-containing protein [Curvibacter sp. RS43]MDD0817028.1 cyclic nucleotide-binding domain-containing protein [Curvibacter sp. HBC28]
MKGILGLLKQKTAPRPEETQDSILFSTAFAGQGVDQSMLVPWEARAVEVGAKRLSASRGSKLLQNLWAKDKYMALLQANGVERMERFFVFATVPANRDLILQDEYGNFMVVLLTGTIAVDRAQPWGEHLRLAETRPGDILGEMSLLDSGIRFSACTTLTDCEVAVLSAEALDDMMTQDPQLAASLVALLARKLSLRLRVVSARLSDNHK